MNREQEKERRRQVWQETKDHYAKMRPQDSIQYQTFDFTSLPSVQGTTTIEFYKADCIEVGLDYVRQGGRPVLLNMASEYKPGGGVENGVHTQEEELFRRSNYHKYLHRRDYPTPPIYVAYSPGVEFYRGGADSDYEHYDTPIKIDCIALAGLRRPQLSADGRRIALRADIQTLENKIRLLIYAAAVQGNDVLILSALGCGAFACPPVHVAQIFKKIICENEGRFKKIVFAILGSNYEPFRTAYMRTP